MWGFAKLTSHKPRKQKGRKKCCGHSYSKLILRTQHGIVAKIANTFWQKILTGILPQRIFFSVWLQRECIPNAALNVRHLVARKILRRFQRRGLKTVREVTVSFRRKY